ncbi:MAG: DUF4276 family protein [bacterium]|nr:DUF4276 family protein [bacterium]
MRKLFVEGGGNNNSALKTECRRALSKLLKAAGFEGRLPRIVPCGGRRHAYDQFCTAVQNLEEHDLAVLLVDSEVAVAESSPWTHVKQREGDGWDKPDDASDDQLHLMVQCMEAWFLADREAMREFFGDGYREKALPPVTGQIENVSKTDMYSKLKAATKDTKTKGAYGKGEHSFKLLARLDPDLVRKASPWAERFFSTLDTLLDRAEP